MKIYAIILLCLFGLIFLNEILNDEPEKANLSVVSLLVFLPLFGRVLGWW